MKNNNNSLVYDNYDIVFSEIPTEVCLAFSIMGCKNRCKGCHSPHLRELNGKSLSDDIDEIVLKYKGLVTTVLLLGEGHDKKTLINTIKTISDKGLKLALYSGRDIIDNDLVELLDYYKVGSYKEELGGLNNPYTNQKLFKIENGNMTDITHLFHNK